jgi:hypothetical protein
MADFGPSMAGAAFANDFKGCPEHGVCLVLGVWRAPRPIDHRQFRAPKRLSAADLGLSLQRMEGSRGKLNSRA